MLRSDLFKIYRIYLNFDLGRIAVFSFRLIHKLPRLVICLIGCKLLVIMINPVKPIRLNHKLNFVQIHTFVGLYIVTRHASALDLAVPVAHRHRQLIADP